MDALAQPEPWSDVAAGYRQHTDPHATFFSLDAIRRLHLAPGASVLDVACGSGAATVPLATDGHRVTAVDFSPGMLSELRSRLAADELDSVDVVEADGQALPFDDASFDAGLSMFGLMFFPDRAAGLRELFRCVRPSGRVALGSWVPLADSPGMQHIVGAMHAAIPELPPSEPAEDGFDNVARIVEELGNAGFEGVEVHRVAHKFEIADAATFWNGMAEGSAAIRMFRAHLGDDWDAVNAAAIAHLEATLETPLEISLPALITVADRP